MDCLQRLVLAVHAKYWHQSVALFTALGLVDGLGLAAVALPEIAAGRCRPWQLANGTQHGRSQNTIEYHNAVDRQDCCFAILVLNPPAFLTEPHCPLPRRV